MSSNITINKVCQFCGKPFLAHKLTTRYCSLPCNRRHYKLIEKEKKMGEAIPLKLKETKVDKIIPQQPFLHEKQFLSIQEAAALIGVSPRSISRQIKKNVIKAGKLGKRVIIKKSELEKFFK